MNRVPKPTPAKVETLPAHPVTDLHQLPLMLMIDDISRIYRLAVNTIRRQLQNNTFRPLPFDKYPYRWTRDAVQQDLQTRRPKLKSRRHGFAATKAKREGLVTK